MEKKILLAVDGSNHSKDAVKYACKISLLVKDLSYTLFNVQPPVSWQIQEGAAKDVGVRKLEKINRNNAEEARRFLEEFKTLMVGLGEEEELIDTVTRPRTLGTAKDILEYARKGLYDAIVVGRRGHSLFKEVFLGSISSNLLEHARNIPVWVVDGDVTSAKVLLAADGSESSIRAAEHLSFMAAQSPDVRITLFHVVLEGSAPGAFIVDGFTEDFIMEEDRHYIRDFHARARRMFKDAGISEDRVEIKEVWHSGNVGSAIVEEAKKGDYGTVVVGRRGVNQAFFMGSVSKYVLNRTEGRALWVVS
jgi:nucleotide-binding universal stress UspA family protein